MGFFSNAYHSIGKKIHSAAHSVSSFGKKIYHGASNAVHSIGKKVSNVASRVGHAGARIAHKVAHIAGDYVAPIAGGISLGAKAVGGVLALTGVGAPIAGVVEGIGSFAGSVSRGAHAVELGANLAEKGFKGAEKLGNKGKLYFK